MSWAEVLVHRSARAVVMLRDTHPCLPPPKPPCSQPPNIDSLHGSAVWVVLLQAPGWVRSAPRISPLGFRPREQRLPG